MPIKKPSLHLTILIATLCLIFSMKMAAQPSNIGSPDSADRHRLRAGDKFRGYETTYISDVETGEGILWDMRDIPTDGDRHRLSYTGVQGDSSIMAGQPPVCGNGIRGISAEPSPVRDGTGRTVGYSSQENGIHV